MASSDVDAIETDDPVVRLLSGVFVKIPHHRRLYPDAVIPRLVAALREQGLLVEPGPAAGRIATTARS